MLQNYTAKYSKIASGYMGQLIEWPEVVTEGKDIEECRMMLRDALNEMLLAYKQQRKEIPIGGALIEPSTELRPMKFANKLTLNQSFEIAAILKKEIGNA